MALVEKKAKGSLRLIHNLCYPEGESVNDQIKKYKGSVKYQTLDDAIQTILTLGPGCVLNKTDICHAFKIIPVHPTDWSKLGIFWKSKYWFDLSLPQGGRTSCKLFEQLSRALEWIANHKLSIPHIHHILDDFLMIMLYQSLAPIQSKIFVVTCDYLDIETVVDKTESGTTLTSLGVELDTLNFQAQLPEEKLGKCCDNI